MRTSWQNWDWSALKGSQPALKYARRDLHTLARALAYVKRNTICVQAGGCLGVFPKYLSAHFKKVYTFEPSESLFDILCQNAPEKNIKPYNMALGCVNEFVGTSQTRRGDKAHRYPHEGITHISGAGQVRSVLLDGFNFSGCDFLCLDLEGYELYALRGAIGTLRKYRPVVMVEINDNILYYDHTPDEVRSLLNGLDYKLKFRIFSDEVYVPC